ncbi:F-box/LRR-repeat protein At1g67190-like [Lycium barbarum]|uniref:F-box/LRR-repeat protein At1g67190-like n=1 Tax=Lycium barbarum TaxID=112863 RepID=UPI00293F2A70|nr:F-box/LRR-repeat protein At1g67190-like [Lycium barbarum]
MEYFPVEIIGNILSRLGAARDVVVASLTCRKWREARRNHLDALTFNSNDWPVYDELPWSRLEVIITQTIFQTNSLQCLSIILKNDVGFSAAPVIAWLMYTRDTLRQLHYNADTPNLNILEKCGRQSLELLDLAENTITGFGSSYQKFPCLRSLSLTHVNISTLDLSNLLSACPKVEVLSLDDMDFDTSGPEFSMRLSSNSLKDIRIEAIQLREIILEADSLKKLHLKDCNIGSFALLSNGTLRILELDNVDIFPLDIGENAENLEIVKVSNFTTFRSDFHHMIVRLSKVRRMSLCFVMFEDEDDEFMHTEATSACFPHLSRLSLTDELREELQCGLLGYRQLENLVVLELGWKVISDSFSDWVVEFLERCPNLRKLVILGAVSGVNTHEECHILANFTTFIVRLMRKYLRVDIHFKYV